MIADRSNPRPTNPVITAQLSVENTPARTEAGSQEQDDAARADVRYGPLADIRTLDGMEMARWPVPD